MIFSKKIFNLQNGLVTLVMLTLVACQNIGQNSFFNNQTSKEVNKNLLTLNPNKGLVFLQDEPFTGTSFTTYSNGKKATSIEYVDGKKHGFYRKWFENGQLSYESKYATGKKHGATKSWWVNGNIRSESFSENGISNGQHKQWYKNGAKFKVMNLVKGKEQGLQQSWRENGKIYNNYEAKDGRIFGLKRASLCYELDDEIIQYKTD